MFNIGEKSEIVLVKREDSPSFLTSCNLRRVPRRYYMLNIFVVPHRRGDSPEIVIFSVFVSYETLTVIHRFQFSIMECRYLRRVSPAEIAACLILVKRVKLFWSSGRTRRHFSALTIHGESPADNYMSNIFVIPRRRGDSPGMLCYQTTFLLFLIFFSISTIKRIAAFIENKLVIIDISGESLPLKLQHV